MTAAICPTRARAAAGTDPARRATVFAASVVYQEICHSQQHHFDVPRIVHYLGATFPGFRRAIALTAQ